MYWRSQVQSLHRALANMTRKTGKHTCAWYPALKVLVVLPVVHPGQSSHLEIPSTATEIDRVSRR